MYAEQPMRERSHIRLRLRKHEHEDAGTNREPSIARESEGPSDGDIFQRSRSAAL